MKYIGAHVSIAGGVSNAPIEAQSIGARAFALFTGSSNRWKSKDISKEEEEKFKKYCEEFGFTNEHILPHDNFLINLGSPDEEKLALSRQSFLDETRRCEQLGLKYLNFHPGSHVNKMSEEECLDKIAESLNLILPQTENVIAVIENTAGQGSNLGYDFAHLAHIIEKVDNKDRVGVCIDTCHAYSAGYDLATPEGYSKTWKEFDDIIGAQYLKGIHLNDDKRALGSRIDRHESLRKGTLGEGFFEMFVNDPRFDNIPIILETPNPEIWKEEIEWLYSLIRE
ncbi:MAG: deoxyribonuclease IV [Muribaculaceae bacterium]|nr:deoxyribonuclease IV [Muribaculaceae bacterium]